MAHPRAASKKPQWWKLLDASWMFLVDAPLNLFLAAMGFYVRLFIGWISNAEYSDVLLLLARFHWVHVKKLIYHTHWAHEKSSWMRIVAMPTQSVWTCRSSDFCWTLQDNLNSQTMTGIEVLVSWELSLKRSLCKSKNCLPRYNKSNAWIELLLQKKSL